MTLTVHSLRKSGHKVHVNHRRRYFDPVNRCWCLLTEYDRSMSPLPDFVKPDSKGGETEVFITSRAGANYIGVAYCSKKDVFNRKVGVAHAISSILKNVLGSNPSSESSLDFYREVQKNIDGHLTELDQSSTDDSSKQPEFNFSARSSRGIGFRVKPQKLDGGGGFGV